MDDFTPINRWPKQQLHLRNIEIGLEVLGGKTYKEVGAIYKLSENRVMQVFRMLAAKLYARHFGIPFSDAVYDSKCYRFEGLKPFMRDYHQQYIAWMINNKPIKNKIGE